MSLRQDFEMLLLSNEAELGKDIKEMIEDLKRTICDLISKNAPVLFNTLFGKYLSRLYEAPLQVATKRKLRSYSSKV